MYICIIIYVNTFAHYYKCIKFNYVNFFKKGQIEDEGTFTALQEKHATFLEILMRTEEVNEKMKEPLKINANSMSDVTQNGNVNNEDTEKAEPQETEELLAKGSLSKFIYWKYLRSGASIIMIVCFLFCTILGQIGSNGCDYWVGYW